LKPQFPSNIGWLGTLAVAALCLLSRLPQLTSPYLHADPNGDECVLGLMASHMAGAQEFPFYFWGQHYGFSWIEAGAVALAIKFFGTSIFSLKVPMLLLWTLGCVFFYWALALWTTRTHGFWITCLLIFSPGWMVWSMRARGGYITAFLLTTIILFLMARSRPILNKGASLGTGILLGFIFFSQPIFLLGVLPVLGYVICKQKNFKDVFICIAGFIGVFMLGKVMAHLQGNTDYWRPSGFRYDSFPTFLSTFKDRVFYSLIQDPVFGKNRAPVIITNTWCAVFLVGLGFYIWRLITRKVIPRSTPFLTSVVLLLGYTFFTNCEDQYRYLASLGIFLILWFGIQSFEWMNSGIFFRVLRGMVIGFFIIFGIFAAWNYKDFYRTLPASSKEVPEMRKLSELIGYLKASGIKYVFSVDDDLSWKLMFFSQEEIISRWGKATGRQPAYIKAVNQAFLGGEKVAVVGNIRVEPVAYLVIETEGKPDLVADQYFVYLSPSIELIVKKLGFQLYQLPTVKGKNV